MGWTFSENGGHWKIKKCLNEAPSGKININNVESNQNGVESLGVNNWGAVAWDPD